MANIPSESTNSFGRVSDLIRDIFKENIQSLFTSTGIASNGLLAEIPIIEKYEIDQDQEDQMMTVINIILQFPDQSKKLPLIAITSIGGSQRVLSIGTQYISTEFYKAQILAPNAETWNVNDGDTLIVYTKDGVHTAEMGQFMFADATKVTCDRLVEMINVQIPSLNCANDGTGKLIVKVKKDHDFVKIGSGTLNTVLGLVSGATDTGDDHPVYGVYQLAEEVDVSLDVVAGDFTQRNQIMDLLSSYFGFYSERFDPEMATPAYTKYSWIGDTNSQENWQIIFSNRYRRRGESEVPFDGNPPRDRLYVDGFTIPITVIVYRKKQLQAISSSAIQFDTYGVSPMNQPN